LDQDMNEAGNAIEEIFLLLDMKHGLHYRTQMASKMN